MESLRAYNLKLLANILPMYVAEHFLKTQNSKDEVRVVYTGSNSLAHGAGYWTLIVCLSVMLAPNQTVDGSIVNIA